MISSHNGQPSARITVPEICERLGLGEYAGYALLKARVIPSIRIRTRYLIGRCAYEEWEKHIGTNMVDAHRELAREVCGLPPEPKDAA